MLTLLTWMLISKSINKHILRHLSQLHSNCLKCSKQHFLIKLRSINEAVVALNIQITCKFVKTTFQVCFVYFSNTDSVVSLVLKRKLESWCRPMWYFYFVQNEYNSISSIFRCGKQGIDFDIISKKKQRKISCVWFCLCWIK